MRIDDLDKIASPKEVDPFAQYYKSGAFKDAVSLFKKRKSSQITHAMTNAMTAHKASTWNRQENRTRKQMSAFPAREIPSAYSDAVLKDSKFLSNYTKEIKNMANNIDIVFTPISVLITSKHKGKKIPLESIETGNMNKIMLQAWRNHDELFFKKYILDKMQYDAQTVEQKVFFKGLRESIDFHNQYSKQASEVMSEYDEDIPFFNLLFYGEKYAQYSEDTIEKIASTIDATEPEPVYMISDTDFKTIFDTIGPEVNIVHGDMLKTAANMITYNDIVKDLDVIFLPDRVVFTVKNNVLTTIFTKDMDIETAKHFTKKDSKFFRKIFARQASVYKSRKMYYGMMPMEKKAGVQKSKSVFNISSIFTLNFIHPYIYFYVLTKKYGKKWIETDNFVMIKNIENDFKVPIIDNSALNKIMSIMSINSPVSDLAYVSKHAFEKIIRSFNDLPVDFEKKETDSLGMNEIAFGLECYNMCSFDHTSYGKFGPDVYGYIIDVLVDKDIYAFYPQIQNASQDNFEFFQLLNKSLLAEIIKRDNDAILDIEIESETAKNDEIVQAGIIGSLDFLRSGEAQSIEDINAHVRSFCEQTQIEPYLAMLIREQAQKNYEMDAYLEYKKTELQNQINLYNL